MTDHGSAPSDAGAMTMAVRTGNYRLKKCLSLESFRLTFPTVKFRHRYNHHRDQSNWDYEVKNTGIIAWRGC